ncbi:MAG: PBP1A family penicillin-binding protein [Verrucomicrobiota bacterium]
MIPGTEDDYLDNYPGYMPPTRNSVVWKRRFLQMGIVFTLVASIVSLATYVYYRELAEAEDITRVGEMPERSLVFDRKGAEMGRMHGVNRVVVPLKAVSPYFLNALLAREDSRFYRHGGIDFQGIARAVVRNVKDLRFTQGASTLTMQLARVSFDIREKTLNRKVLETMLAQRIEANYSKGDILSFYVNRVYFGTGLFGVERASQAYFGKHASELRLGEAAMLAGIIRAPNRFSPFRHFEDAIRERDMVLNRMLKMGYITAEEVAKAKSQQIVIANPSKSRVFQNSYALDLVRRDLDLILEKSELEDGGLLIYTTLDFGLQQFAESALERNLSSLEKNPNFTHQKRVEFQRAREAGESVKPEYLQGAVVMLDNANGGIRAIVGGRQFDESQYNRATMGRRQIGSLFKPLVYAAAYEEGLLPGTLVDDGPLSETEIPWNGDEYWSPNNSDGLFTGLQPAELGLFKSRNTMTVRVGEIAGFENVAKLATRAGMDLPEERSAQLYIGNLGADLRTVTSAFSAFPEDGERSRPFIIEAIQDQRGNVIYKNKESRTRIMTKGAAYLARKSLEKGVAPGGTGVRARAMGLRGPAGGKTGTTDGYRDAWFVGFSDKLTGGVWVGLDKPGTIIDRGYGSTLALPIWTEIMNHASSNGYPLESFQSDVSLVNVEVCRVSGGLANWACGQGGHSYQTAVPYELVPNHSCEIHGTFRLAGRANPMPQPEPVDRKSILGRLRGWFQ